MWSFLGTATLISLISVSALADITPVCVRAMEAKAYENIEVLKRSPKKKSGPEPSVVFPRYSPLKWTGKKEGSWFEVQTIDNFTYWVARKDLSFKMNCLIVFVNKSVLYAGPGPKYGKVDVVEKGVVFQDLGGEDGWTQVQHRDGRKAWINLDHTWKPASIMRMSFPAER